MPHVLHVVDSLRTGGLERVVVSLANGLARRGYPQTVCCLRQAGPLARDLDPDVRLIQLEARGRDWSLARRLHDLIAVLTPDVVHGQNLGTWADVIRAAHRRCPVVQSLHGFLDAGLPLPRRFLVRRLAAQTDRVVAVSHALAAETARRFRLRLERILVIPNGVDVGRFVPGERGAAETAARGLVGDRFFCVTVASLTPAKAPETLVRAALELPDDVAFAWVGDGPLAADTRRLIRHAGLAHRFLLAGPQADVRPWLRAADLFVLPSRTEALPMCVLEAQAAGLPVVATRVGDLPLLILDGRTGLLAAPEDSHGLAARIAESKADPSARLRMARAARDRILHHYTVEQMADRHLEAYAEVMGGKRQPAGAAP